MDESFVWEFMQLLFQFFFFSFRCSHQYSDLEIWAVREGKSMEDFIFRSGGKPGNSSGNTSGNSQTRGISNKSNFLLVSFQDKLNTINIPVLTNGSRKKQNNDRR